MSKPMPRIVACAGALLACAAARAEPAVVGLARAYLGPESTLDAVTSIHFVGSLERVDPDHADKGSIRGTIDLIFAKPLRQRQVVRLHDATETTVLDGYDAWDLLQDGADPAKHVLTWMGAADIKAIRASTWENLYFFRPNRGEVAVEDKGPATADGVACERVDFVHGSGIVFERYFDRDTGRLVSTTRGPETLRESGEIRANGVRFPKTVVSVQKTASGKDLVSTVTFDSVVLNEPVGPDAFAAPSLVQSKSAQATAGPQVK
jgi:hypothetical protein